MKPKKKEKLLSIPKLKKKVWTVFSKWIRERDKYTCYTCGKVMYERRYAHAGHYLSRRKASVLFDEMNVHCQCIDCNLWSYGNTGVYAQNLIRDYGKESFDGLIKRSFQLKQWTRPELDELLMKYGCQ